MKYLGQPEDQNSTQRRTIAQYVNERGTVVDVSVELPEYFRPTKIDIDPSDGGLSNHEFMRDESETPVDAPEEAEREAVEEELELEPEVREVFDIFQIEPTPERVARVRESLVDKDGLPLFTGEVGYATKQTVADNATKYDFEDEPNEKVVGDEDNGVHTQRLGNGMFGVAVDASTMAEVMERVNEMMTERGKEGFVSGSNDEVVAEVAKMLGLPEGAMGMYFGDTADLTGFGRADAPEGLHIGGTDTEDNPVQFPQDKDDESVAETLRNNFTEVMNLVNDRVQKVSEKVAEKTPQERVMEQVDSLAARYGYTRDQNATEHKPKSETLKVSKETREAVRKVSSIAKNAPLTPEDVKANVEQFKKTFREGMKDVPLIESNPQLENLGDQVVDSLLKTVDRLSMGVIRVTDDLISMLDDEDEK